MWEQHIKKYLENLDEVLKILKKAIHDGNVDRLLKGPMKAGFSRSDITPPLGIPIEGNFREDNLSKGVYHEIYSHSACFSDGNNVCSLTSVEICGIPGEIVREIRERVSKNTSLEPDSILICATHTHSGPVVTGVLQPENVVRKFIDRLIGQVSESIINAYQEMKPVEVRFGRGEEHTLSYNRRIWTKDGELHMNWEKIPPDLIVGEAGPIDPEILVLSFHDSKGKVKGILINFTLHPAVLAGDNNLTSGDYVGFTGRELAAHYRNNPEVLFFNGAEGNVNHINHYDPGQKRGFEEAGRIGKLLAEDVIKIMTRSEKIDVDVVSCFQKDITLKRRRISQDKIDWAKEVLAKWDGKPISLVDGVPDEAYAKAALSFVPLQDKSVGTEIQIIQVGEVRLVTLPGEVFVEYGLRIKEMVGNGRTFVIGLANDNIGYVPTRQAFKEGGYEVTLGGHSYLDENTGEIILEEIRKLLRE